MSLRAPASLATARRPAARGAALLIAAALLAGATAIAYAALLAAPPAGAHAAAHAWRLPVDGTVAGRFSYNSGAPFASGARRGLDLAASPGSAVRAACRGVVSWTGRLPGSRARGVTVRCGGLAATHLGLAAVAVRRGEPVSAGTRLGALGPGGVLRLGARRVESRLGYVDPAALLAEHPPGVAPPALVTRPRDGPPEGPPPRAPAPRAAPTAPRTAPAHTRPSPHASPLAHLPLLAWAGLALLAAGAAGGAARAASVLRQRCPSTSPRRSTTSTRPRISGTPTRRSRPT